jgi:hydrogenase maturation protease
MTDCRHPMGLKTEGRRPKAERRPKSETRSSRPVVVASDFGLRASDFPRGVTGHAFPMSLRILVIGYGNPGRCDDGLGPAFAARLEALHLPGVTVESDYQLSIEHAHLAAQHDIVVFADAAADVGGESPFYLRRVQPAPEDCYSSHRVSPQAVLRLAAQCFGAHPSGWVLGIRPTDLESFAEGLTLAAAVNLSAALTAFCEAVKLGRLAQ